MKNVNFNEVKITDDLFVNRIRTVSETSILSAIEKCYNTPRINNFLEAKKAINNETAHFDGIVYDDADIYKIMEGACYILQQEENEKLQIELDRLIDIVIDAQEESGYITTKHTIYPEMKWVCLDAHEMYNMGHLIEATVAHYLYSNNPKFLNVGIKAADYLYEEFGKTKSNWVPGHQEIELALLKLYRITENKNYLELCDILLENRGKNNGWVNNDYKDKAVFIPHQEVEWNKAYHQDSVPLTDISKVEGHAVRAMYMYTAMAELSEYKDQKYLESLKCVWDNLVYKNMYITGGIGSTKINEGFTQDYDLPNDTAYCETCASVGMVFWNSKMFELTKNPVYLDVIERELKNGTISGLSEDGKRYFYDNPLSSDGTVGRQEWFETSCCPTQLMRFIPQISNFIYYQDEESYIIAQPISSILSQDDGEIILNVKTEYFEITNNTTTQKKFLVRQPLGCAFDHEEARYERGFLVVYVMPNECIKINTQYSVQTMKCNNLVQANVGRTAIEYKGFVYCAEEVDNGSDLNIDINNILTIENSKIGHMNIEKINYIDENGNQLSLIPYYAWNNRGAGKMEVWINDNNKNLYR